MNTTPGSASLQGLSSSARAFGKTLSELIHIRLELASIEFREQRNIAKHEMILVAVAAEFFNCSLVLAAGLVILFFWDSHRLLAALLVTLAYVSVGVWALLQLNTLRRDCPLPFAATIAEFEQDLRHLRGEGK